MDRGFLSLDDISSIFYDQWMIYRPIAEIKILRGDIRGYTRYCGEMKQWTDNVEHVAFLGKKKIQVLQARKKVIISIITRYNTFLTSARYIITQNIISLDT